MVLAGLERLHAGEPTRNQAWDAARPGTPCTRRETAALECADLALNIQREVLLGGARCCERQEKANTQERSRTVVHEGN